MKIIYTYRMALLMTEGKFSCHKSACKLENISHDKLTRFLSNNEENPALDIKIFPKAVN